MTTGGLIVLICGCVAWGLFGIYAGLHKENNDKHNKHKHKHA